MFSWVKIHKEFAEKVGNFKNKQIELIKKTKAAFKKAKKEIIFDHPVDGHEDHIDPFTIFSAINKFQRDDIRIGIWKGMKEEFNLSSDLPKDFKGIPTSNPMRVWLYCYSNDPKYSPEHIKNLWNLYDAAKLYANEKNEDNYNHFCQMWNIVRGQPLIKWNITMSLYWLFPDTFIALDSHNRDYIEKSNIFPNEIVSKLKYILDGDIPPLGNVYLDFCNAMKNYLDEQSKNFWDLSQDAYDFEPIVPVHPQDEEPSILPPHSDELDQYTLDDFVSETYLNNEEASELLNLLNYNKNIILQGPPGTGKTYIAKRLAKALCHYVDNDLIQTVQFHPNYSYEEFIMGYKPDGSGFKLSSGIFKNFCKKAGEVYTDKKMCFIIDEVNRGDVNKIFGEALMTIDKDMRGKGVKLYYQQDENFSVPQNVYIIATMNNADKSLSMLDYAMRRRFAFYNLPSKLNDEKFLSHISSFKSNKLSKTIDLLNQINKEIINDATLGEDYCIGHSFFCNFKDKNDIDAKLPMIIKYNIIPLLKEYWFENISKFNEYQEKLLSLLTND